MQSILGANHNYEKSSLSFCFTRRFNFDFLLCKRDLKIKNKFAPGTGKKSRRHSICKTFRSGSAKALRYFLCSQHRCCYLAPVASHSSTCCSLFRFLFHAKAQRLNTKTQCMHCHRNTETLCASVPQWYYRILQKGLCNSWFAKPFASPAKAGQVCVNCINYVQLSSLQRA